MSDSASSCEIRRSGMKRTSGGVFLQHLKHAPDLPQAARDAALQRMKDDKKNSKKAKQLAKQQQQQQYTYW